MALGLGLRFDAVGGSQGLGHKDFGARNSRGLGSLGV